MAERPPLPTAPNPPSGTGMTGAEARPRAVTHPQGAPAPVDAKSKTEGLLGRAPKLEMPKGGGAIRGVGEAFKTNPATGTAGFSVPLGLPPGRAGLQPSLALSYDSGSGNGPFGLGWSVGLPSVRRRTDRGLPKYRDAHDSDTFVLSGAEELVPYQAWSGTAWAVPALADATEDSVTYARRRYRPRAEDGFARIERWTAASSGEVHWRTWTPQNVRRIYGKTTTAGVAARVANPDRETQVFEWFLEEERDELGNVIRYEYLAEDRVDAPATQAEAMRAKPKNQCTYTYLKRILYGNVTSGSPDDGFYFEIVFDYGDHTGEVNPALPATPTAPSHSADVAWSIRQDIQSNFRAGFDQRCYRLCRRVLVFHRFDDPTGASEPTLVRSLEFAHDPSPIATTLTSIRAWGWRYDSAATTWTTLALPAVDLGYVPATIDAAVQFAEGLEDLPQGLDTSRWQWVDLDGEGLTGLLTEQGGAWCYKRSLGAGEFGPARVIRSRPSTASLRDRDSRLMDIDGDGRLEVVYTGAGMASTSAREADGEWGPARPIRSLPSVGLNDPDVRLLDLDGDGLADVLLSGDDCFTWYRSEGRDGWGDPTQVRKLHDEDEGPTLVFSSAGESIFLADMTGDGLADLVRVRNRNICYWPNRGFARFGAKVQMTHAPWFDSPQQFDARRLRFADIDGTGPADLIYIGPDSVRLWSNESGNRWGDTFTLSQFPGVENSAVVQVADLLGDGTACLTWASPLARDGWAPLRYVHLMAEGKPYLLRSVTNNLGRTTTITYAPSTQFMVADREAGTPWATRLPFPVQVVEKMTVEDAVTGWSNTTTYAYHHGYFDADEREFRGFGKVEQWDTGSLPLEGSTTDLAPVRTVTWFHTGAWRVQGTLEAAYAAEYFVDADTLGRVACAVAISDADPAPLNAREQREAYRALRGRPLRQEVYAEDGTDRAAIPYTTTETSFTVSRVQRASNDIHGVFQVAPLETLTRHTERNPDEARIAQELVLEVDVHGVVLRSATVAYPRAGATEDEQSTGVILVSRNEVIDDISALDAETDAAAMRWHVGVAWRARAWHLIPGLTGFPSGRATVAGLSALLPTQAGGSASTTVLAFDAAVPATTDCLRKLADKVTTYDDGGSEATAGTMGTLALPYQAYQLAYTATQASALDTLLDDLGLGSTHTVVDQGYIELTAAPFTGVADVSGTWARSGTQSRDAANFYVTTALADPFGAATTVSWHASYLFPESVIDALGNESEVTYDLLALAPQTVTDPNRNVTQARFDALGRVTAIARASDTGDGEADLDDPSQSFTYDLTVIPAVAFAEVRDLHASVTGTARWIQTYAYSDGAGNVVMQKATTAPDVATPTTDRWVGSGRVVLNNKGLPIKQYEPFFSDSFAFEAEEGFSGVTPVITYDPLGRATRVDLPNGTFRKVAFAPWGSVSWDENDASDEATDADAALVARAAAHVATPSAVKLDVQGRPYRTREFLSAVTETEYESGGSALETSVALDVAGNPTVVTDARGNDIQTQSFDLLGRPILTSSPDGGDITSLLDVGGQPRFLWKSGDLCEEAEYDALRRRARTWEWLTSGTPAKTLRERIVYGEALEDSGTYDPRDDDLRGRAVYVYDGAGRVESAYDWKGSATSVTRRFADDGESVPNWTVHDGYAYPFDGDDSISVDDFTTSAEADLESETFVATSTFDALDRIVTATAPDGQLTENGFDAGGRLTSVSVTTRDTATTEVVSAITYNARGQRESIAYGNGATTTHTYEADTFRLSRLYTEGDPDGDSSADAVQDLNYLYDPVGNIVSIENAAEDTLYHDNAAVDPSQSFTYDALYRLIEATGRERTDRDAPGYVDPAAGTLPCSETKRTYTETYEYDEVGNIAEVVHVAGGSTTWSRTYTYETTSNRLVSTEVVSAVSGTITEDYVHDDRGNMIYLPTLRFSSGGATPNIEVSFRNQMVRAVLPTLDQEAFYAYDAGGQRVRKRVVEGTTSERRYVGGWEVYREYDGTVVEEERSTLHVADGQSRALMIETKTVTVHVEETTFDPVLRYQLGDHLGTVAIELDENGEILSYEEYHPYGTTAWQAPSLTMVSLKRYKYTGMERDEETGLQRHGVRYYATWLGRWTSADPIGLGDGGNRYCYCHGAPIGGIDPSGLGESPACHTNGTVDPAPLAIEPLFATPSVEIPENAIKTHHLALGSSDRPDTDVSEAEFQAMRQKFLADVSATSSDPKAPGYQATQFLIITDRDPKNNDLDSQGAMWDGGDFRAAALEHFAEISKTDEGLSALMQVGYQEGTPERSRKWVRVQYSAESPEGRRSGDLMGGELTLRISPTFLPQALASRKGLPDYKPWWDLAQNDAAVIASAHELAHVRSFLFDPKQGNLLQDTYAADAAGRMSKGPRVSIPALEVQGSGLPGTEFSGYFFSENTFRTQYERVTGRRFGLRLEY